MNETTKRRGQSAESEGSSHDDFLRKSALALRRSAASSVNHTPVRSVSDARQLCERHGIEVVEADLPAGNAARLTIRHYNLLTPARARILFSRQLDNPLFPILHELGHFAWQFDFMANMSLVYHQLCLYPHIEGHLARLFSRRRLRAVSAVHEIQADCFAVNILGIPLSRSRRGPGSSLGRITTYPRAGSIDDRISWLRHAGLQQRDCSDYVKRVHRALFRVTGGPRNQIVPAFKEVDSPTRRTHLERLTLNSYTTWAHQQVSGEPVILLCADRKTPPFHIPLIKSTPGTNGETMWVHALEAPWRHPQSIQEWIQRAEREHVHLMLFSDFASVWGVRMEQVR